MLCEAGKSHLMRKVYKTTPY